MGLSIVASSGGDVISALMGRDLLSIWNLTAPELIGLLDLSEEMKRHPERYRGPIDGRSVALLVALLGRRGRG
jgi:ornithine carbamoyltransferase